MEVLDPRAPAVFLQGFGPPKSQKAHLPKPGVSSGASIVATEPAEKRSRIVIMLLVEGVVASAAGVAAAAAAAAAAVVVHDTNYAGLHLNCSTSALHDIYSALPII